MTRSGWRLAISCGEGPGAVVRLEDEDGREIYRGEGVFLGWPQDRLAEAYRSLVPRSDEPVEEMLQLG